MKALVKWPHVLRKHKRVHRTRTSDSRRGRQEVWTEAPESRASRPGGLEKDFRQGNKFRFEFERHGLAASWKMERWCQDQMLGIS